MFSIKFQMSRSAEIYGHFVPPTTWCPLVTERLLANPSQGELMILAKIMDGSDPELLKYCLEDLAITLQDDSICLSLCVSLKKKYLKILNSEVALSVLIGILLIFLKN